MREVGVCGVTRRKKWRTTIRDTKARLAPDLVEREFRAVEADQLWVADITEIPTRSSKFLPSRCDRCLEQKGCGVVHVTKDARRACS